MKSYRELLIKVLPHSKWCVVPTVKWSGENGSPCVCAQLIKISLELARVDDTERLPQDGILEGHFFILSSLHSPSLSLSPPLSLSISLFIFYIEVSGAVTGFWYKGWHKVRHVGTQLSQLWTDLWVMIHPSAAVPAKISICTAFTLWVCVLTGRVMSLRTAYCGVDLAHFLKFQKDTYALTHS